MTHLMLHLQLAPADELAEIRSQIRALKAREAELRAYFLDDRLAPAEGAQARVVFTEQKRRIFDKALLPSAVHDDPRYWQIDRRRVVKCVGLEGSAPVGPAAAEPVWRRTPIPAASGETCGRSRTVDAPRRTEEVSLIEPFS